MSDASVDIKFASNGPDVFTTLKTSIDSLKESLDGMKDSMDGIREVMDKTFVKVLREAAIKVAAVSAPTVELSTAVTELGDSAKDVEAPVDNLTDSLAAVTETEKKTAAETKKLGGFFDKLRGSFKEVSESALHFNQLRQSISGFGTAVESATEPTRNFEDAMASVRSLGGADLTADEYERLGDTALSLGSKYGVAGADAVLGYQKLLSALDVKKLGGVAGLEALGENVIRFSKATEVSTDVAASALTNTLSQFNMTADEANRVMNVMAAGSRAGKAEVADQIQSMGNLLNIPSNAGLSLENTVSALQAIAGAGLRGAEAGTQLRGVIEQLQIQGHDLSNGGFANVIESLKGQNLDAASMKEMFGDSSRTVYALMDHIEELRAYEDKVRDAGAVQAMLGEQMSTTNSQMARFNQTISNTVTSFMKDYSAIALVGSVLSKVGIAMIGFAQITDAARKVTSLFTAAKAVEGEVTTKSKWATIGDMFVKAKAAIATKAMAAGNFIASASTWTLTGSLTALRVAIFNIPIVGWILAAISALATLIYYWDDLRYTLIGIWEVIKNIFSAMFGMAELDIGGAFNKGFDGAASKDQAEKDKEAKQQKLMDGITNIDANAISGLGDGALGGGIDQAGTSASAGGSIMTAQPAATSTTSQSVSIQAVNITVTTPRELVDQVKAEVIKALTMAISPTVGAAYNIQ